MESQQWNQHPAPHPSNPNNPTLIFFATFVQNSNDSQSQSNGPGSKATKMIKTTSNHSHPQHKTMSFAKAYVDHLIHTNAPHTNPRFTDDAWSIYLGPNKQTRFHKQQIYDYITQPTITEYWSKNGTIPPTPPSTAPHLLQPLRPYPQLNKKESPNTPPVILDAAPNFYNGNTKTTTLAPCPTTQKDPQHVLLCPHPKSQITWHLALTKLENALHSIHTDPQLTQSLINALHTWHDNTAPTTQPPTHPITHQQTIGWYPFLHAHISPSWCETQTLYLQTNHPNKSPRQWTVQFIKHLLNVSWDMWTHQNGYKHSPDGPDHQQLLQTLHKKIQDKYDTGSDSLLNHDKHWLLQIFLQILIFQVYIYV